MDESLDPIQKVELALIRAEHQKRYAVGIAYIKEQIGAGIEYKNSVVRVVVSETGAYYELNDLPEDFCGGVGDDFERKFITPTEAINLFAFAVESTALVNADNTRQCTLLALYTRRGIVDRKNCYIFDYHSTSDIYTPNPPLIVGKFQPGVMPLFFKIKLDAEFAPDIFGMRRGIVFCMANAGDRHLMIKLPADGENLTDLGAMPVPTTIN